MPGPITRNTSTLALGLAQIRVGASASNISNSKEMLTASDSIGSLANTKFTHEIEYWRHSSGFPQLEDYVIPLRGSAKLECAFEELHPKNLDLALGVDVTTGTYTNLHSGQVELGNLVSPSYMRMEAEYTFPNTDRMLIIFPRAQVESAIEVDLQKEEAAAVPITFAAKRADSAVTDGNAIWDDKPLGVIHFFDTVA